jgi:integrase
MVVMAPIAPPVGVAVGWHDDGSTLAAPKTHARILAAAKPPNIVPHDLLHTCVTLLLAARVNPKVVSEQLGHASVAFTLQTYARALPDMQEGAVAAMAAAMG